MLDRLRAWSDGVRTERRRRRQEARARIERILAERRRRKRRRRIATLTVGAGIVAVVILVKVNRHHEPDYRAPIDREHCDAPLVWEAYDSRCVNPPATTR